jgi:DNA-binding NarL/FixJ family response regulator
MLSGMSKRAVAIVLTDQGRNLLERRLKARTATQREVMIARVVLLASAGKENKEIAEEVGLSSHSVAL